MSLIAEQRRPDSDYIESVMRGCTTSDGSVVRPAESHWHLVFARHSGHILPILVGPWTTAGSAAWGKDANILWIKFKLGVFMPHLPVRDFLDRETILPGAASNTFWLKGSVWQIPDYENVETFVARLVRDEVLVRDPVVESALIDHPQEMSPRTLRHRFLQSTGQAQGHIRQFKRAMQAEQLLRQGVPILDAVYKAGYYDQPHMTRSLKKYTGFTPTQIAQMGYSV